MIARRCRYSALRVNALTLVMTGVAMHHFHGTAFLKWSRRSLIVAAKYKYVNEGQPYVACRVHLQVLPQQNPAVLHAPTARRLLDYRPNFVTDRRLDVGTDPAAVPRYLYQHEPSTKVTHKLTASHRKHLRDQRRLNSSARVSYFYANCPRLPSYRTARQFRRSLVRTQYVAILGSFV